jgi:hypothetical protein
MPKPKTEFEVRAWYPHESASARHRNAPRTEADAAATLERGKREAIRILHRAMRALGEGARGSVKRPGFGYVVQQRLERNATSHRLEFVNEEL